MFYSNHVDVPCIAHGPGIKYIKLRINGCLDITLGLVSTATLRSQCGAELRSRCSACTLCIPMYTLPIHLGTPSIPLYTPYVTAGTARYCTQNDAPAMISGLILIFSERNGEGTAKSVYRLDAVSCFTSYPSVLTN